jgi:hypothetical protein
MLSAHRQAQGCRDEACSAPDRCPGHHFPGAREETNHGLQSNTRLSWSADHARPSEPSLLQSASIIALGPPIRSRMALTICSQFLADIVRTETISSSSLHFSNQSNSRRQESFTFSLQTNSLPLFEINGCHTSGIPKIPKCRSERAYEQSLLHEDRLKLPRQRISRKRPLPMTGDGQHQAKACNQSWPVELASGALRQRR